MMRGPSDLPSHSVFRENFALSALAVWRSRNVVRRVLLIAFTTEMLLCRNFRMEISYLDRRQDAAEPLICKLRFLKSATVEQE
jgi:hypothetical protein